MRVIFCLLAVLLGDCFMQEEKEEQLPLLKISENRRFIQTENGDPFFWLGDTGRLLLSKMDRVEAAKYLDDRQEKGFKVIQAMVLHSLKIRESNSLIPLVK